MPISEVLRQSRAEHYKNRFENDFVALVNDLSSIICISGASAARPVVQSIVNSYYEVCSSLDQTVPNYATLRLFVSITGASLDHSGENESIKILDLARQKIGNL